MGEAPHGTQTWQMVVWMSGGKETVFVIVFIQFLWKGKNLRWKFCGLIITNNNCLSFGVWVCRSQWYSIFKPSHHLMTKEVLLVSLCLQKLSVNSCLSLLLFTRLIHIIAVAQSNTSLCCNFMFPDAQDLSIKLFRFHTEICSQIPTESYFLLSPTIFGKKATHKHTFAAQLCSFFFFFF